jgi:hypothetical protein
VAWIVVADRLARATGHPTAIVDDPVNVSIVASIISLHIGSKPPLPVRQPDFFRLFQNLNDGAHGQKSLVWFYREDARRRRWWGRANFLRCFAWSTTGLGQMQQRSCRTHP